MNLKTVYLGDEYIEMLKHPKHGIGAGFNPCVDCNSILKFSLLWDIVTENDLYGDLRQFFKLREGYLFRPTTSRWIGHPNLPLRSKEVRRFVGNDAFYVLALEPGAHRLVHTTSLETRYKSRL